MNRNRKYSNGIVTVVWQPAECIHSGRCFMSLRRVFDPTRRPWIDLGAARTEEIIDVVEQCPTRALTFFWDDPQRVIAGREHSPKLFDRKDLPRLFPEEAADSARGAVSDDGHNTASVAAAQITFRPGGPLVVEGSFDIVGGDGRTVERGLKMASFCRCGLSDNQPFCDGAHFKGGFRR